MLKDNTYPYVIMHLRCPFILCEVSYEWKIMCTYLPCLPIKNTQHFSSKTFRSHITCIQTYCNAVHVQYLNRAGSITIHTSHGIDGHVELVKHLTDIKYSRWDCMRSDERAVYRVCLSELTYIIKYIFVQTVSTAHIKK